MSLDRKEENIMIEMQNFSHQNEHTKNTNTSVDEKKRDNEMERERERNKAYDCGELDEDPSAKLATILQRIGIRAMFG